jgi:uncharacterized protein YidB (DUF937 family)
MGLLDILNGMQAGPRGSSQPGQGGSGGMSPMTMALLGLLAYKAVKSFSNQAGAGQSAPLPPGGANPGAPGGLGDILGGLLGGSGGPSSGGGLGNILAGPAAGTVLSSGLGGLIRDLQNSGHGQAAQSWVGTGPNQEIAPGNLANALGADTLNALSKQTGLGRDDLLDGLSRYLPGMVDQMTPDGKLPTADEASRMV